jgi:hypothetical protein
MVNTLFKDLVKIPKLFIVALRKCIAQPAEALLLVRMAWWVGFLSIVAKLRPLPRALELVSGKESSQIKLQDAELPTRLAQSIDLVLSADFLFLEPICWKRAAVLRRYLSRSGIATHIIFGVRNEVKGMVEGHAWLEVDGKPFLEKTPPDYVVTYTFPSDIPRETDLVFISK